MDAYEGGLGRDFYFLLEDIVDLQAALIAQPVKNLTCNTGDSGLTHGLGRSPAEGNGNPLQYSCLENSMDRGGCQIQSTGS